MPEALEPQSVLEQKFLGHALFELSPVLAKYGVLLANLVDLLQANPLAIVLVEGGLQDLISEDQ